MSQAADHSFLSGHRVRSRADEADIFDGSDCSFLASAGGLRVHNRSISDKTKASTSGSSGNGSSPVKYNVLPRSGVL